MRLLAGTKCYLVGSMDRAQDGSTWRIEAQKRFQGFGVQCFNPYDKPISRGGEDIQDRTYREKMIQEENWDEVARLMKEVVSIDLRMVDLSDFILAEINVEDKPVGSIWELCIANLQKKPILIVCPGGKCNLPRWLFGVIPHKYVFADFDEAFEFLDEVDRGLHQDSRWKIFKFKIGETKPNPASLGVRPERDFKRNLFFTNGLRRILKILKFYT